MKYYSLKRVFSALRGEYQSIQKEIDELRQHIEFVSPYSKLYLCPYKDEDNERLSLSYVIESTEPESRLSDRPKSLTGMIYDADQKIMHSPGKMIIKDKEAIIDKMEKLNDTEFASHMHMYVPDEFKDKNNKNVTNDLIVWTYLLETVFPPKNRFDSEAIVFYRPYEDGLYVDRTSMLKRVNDNYVKDIMNEELPEYLFRTYHKDIIESYPELDIKVENTKRNNICNRYNIVEEEGKRLVLKR